MKVDAPFFSEKAKRKGIKYGILGIKIRNRPCIDAQIMGLRVDGGILALWRQRGNWQNGVRKQRSGQNGVIRREGGKGDEICRRQQEEKSGDERSRRISHVSDSNNVYNMVRKSQR